MTLAGLGTSVIVGRHRLGVDFSFLQDLYAPMLRRNLSFLLKLVFGFLQDMLVAVARRIHTLLLGFGVSFLQEILDAIARGPLTLLLGLFLSLILLDDLERVERVLGGITLLNNLESVEGVLGRVLICWSVSCIAYGLRYRVLKYCTYSNGGSSG